MTETPHAREFAERCASEFGDRALALALALTRSRADAEDVVQQALLVTLTKVPTDDHWTWFAGVVVNTARNRRRKRRRQSVREAGLEGLSAVDESADPVREAEREELIAQLNASLAKLPQEQREAVALTHLAGLTHQAAAESLGVARETITARARKGVDSLRAQLGAKQSAAALALAAAGVSLSRAGDGGSAVLGAALGGTLMTANKVTLALVALVASGLLWASWPEQDRWPEQDHAPTPPARLQEPAAAPPKLSLEPAPVQGDAELLEAKARVAVLERERAEASSAHARLKRENEDLRRRLAVAESKRELSLREKLSAVGDLSGPERDSAGWSLGRKYGEDVTSEFVLAVLLEESKPGALGAFYSMLRGGAAKAWSGDHLDEVLPLLQDRTPERRRATAYLLAHRLRRAFRKLSREEQQAFEEGRLSDPSLRRIQGALTAALASGDDEVLQATGRQLGAHASGLGEPGRKALRAGAARAQTHAGRRAAYYALGRDPWGGGEAALFKLFESTPEANLRLAIGDALADVWRSQSGSGMFERITPKVLALYRDASSARIRRKLLDAWAHAALSSKAKQVLVEGLRRESAAEADPTLQSAMLKLAAVYEAGNEVGTQTIEEILYGKK
ncbi:MAG: sigma-70 family RNA polymerase sigma factor [Planctomycetes bacterium]|nr:sigma-70 family RNA polymerase sigma factor [Planctomycetota bacterium]